MHSVFWSWGVCVLSNNRLSFICFTQSFFRFRWWQLSIHPAFNLNLSSIYKSFHKTLNGVECKRNRNFLCSLLYITRIVNLDVCGHQGKLEHVFNYGDLENHMLSVSRTSNFILRWLKYSPCSTEWIELFYKHICGNILMVWSRSFMIPQGDGNSQLSKTDNKACLLYDMVKYRI